LRKWDFIGWVYHNLALRVRNLTEPIIVSSISETGTTSLNDSMPCTIYNKNKIMNISNGWIKSRVVRHGLADYNARAGVQQIHESTFMIKGSLHGPLLDLRHPPWLEHEHEPPKNSGNYFVKPWAQCQHYLWSNNHQPCKDKTFGWCWQVVICNHAKIKEISIDLGMVAKLLHGFWMMFWGQEVPSQCSRSAWNQVQHWQ